MPNCHEVRSSRLLQRIPRVQDLVLFYVFFMSSTSLTLSSSDIHVPEIFFWTSQPLFYYETFIFNFAALTTPWGHIVCRGLYHLLASKSADPLPQLLLTINRKSRTQSQIPNHIVTSLFLPPTDIQVCRSRASTTGPRIFLYKCWPSTDSKTLLSGLSCKGSKNFVVPKGVPW